MSQPTAIVSGITGQDGSYLAELLIEKGYKVYGIQRRSSTITTQRIDHLWDKGLETYYGDLADTNSIVRLLVKIQPDEIYNMGSMSHVRVSFDVPEYTAQVTGVAPLRILEAMRSLGMTSKFYQASCYSMDTRVMTENGLKKYDEVNNGELVYSINPHTRNLELKPIKKVIIKDYDGEMYHFGGRRMDILVTPNHRMYLQRDSGEISSFYAEECNELFKYQRTSEWSLPATNCEGELKQTICFRDYIDYAGMATNCSKNLISEMETGDYLYLLGLYIGDGYTQVKRKIIRTCTRKEFTAKRNIKGQFYKQAGRGKIEHTYDSHYIYFAIPETDKSRTKLTNMLDKYGITYRRMLNWVEFSSWPLARMFKQSGDNVYEKHIPAWVMGLNPKHLVLLFDGICDSDGHTRIVKNKRFVITTVSRQLSNDIAILAYRIGMIPSISTHQPHEVRFKDGHLSISKESYYISLAHKVRNKLYPYNITKEQYSGKVWCLEVADNHNMLVERNGKFAFCGNSSEMFGISPAPQSENTPMLPQSPYGCAKLYAYHMTRAYRSGYGMFACNGILFNHESPRRGETFVTKKIVRAAVRISLGKQDKVRLGNLEAKRDWGFAGDYMEAIYMVMQHKEPDDFVVATGEHYSVREFAVAVFRELGLDFYDYLILDDQYKRPNEVPELLGDPSKIKKELGWKARVSFQELISMMVACCLQEERDGRRLQA